MPTASIMRNDEKAFKKNGVRGRERDFDDYTVADIVPFTPSETVQNLLLEVDDKQHYPYNTFCQMDLLHSFGQEKQWKEYARWVKYEEDLEEGGERWSKPHVATLSLHSLFELRFALINGIVLLDLDASNIGQVIDLILQHGMENDMLDFDKTEEIRNVLLSPHTFAHQKRKQFHTSDSEKNLLKRSFSKGSMLKSVVSLFQMEQGNAGLTGNASTTKLNVDFMRKVPHESQACNVMVGEIATIKCQFSAFVRLSEARNIGDITEVPLPTRFVFIHLGQTGSEDKCIEIGRCMSTIMVDEIFREVAYKARNLKEIIAGLDEFLDNIIVLPPGEWDPKIRLEPPLQVPSQEARKTQKVQVAGPHVLGTQKSQPESHNDPTLIRTGKLFGGLIEDVKRKLPWYLSDFKDALHFQCIASTLFLFLVTLTPNVTFGGLLGLATDQYMGTMECILAAAITGVIYALFSGQPLNILGTTGPMLVLEMILCNFCKRSGYDFLPLRCVIGLWTAALLLVIVAFDLSVLVRYITRFTEESFASLIAIIFIYQAIEKQYEVSHKYQINPNPEIRTDHRCQCLPPSYGNTDNLTNITTDIMATTAPIATLIAGVRNNPFFSEVLNNITNVTLAYTNMTKEQCLLYNGSLFGEGCTDSLYYPDVFFFSCLLFIGTYILAMSLYDFKTSPYFPTFARKIVSDFAVLIAVVVMVGIDMLIGIKTPKLEVPENIQPTRYQDRGWFINPASDKNPWWIVIAAVIPAILALVLIFMDQQITAVIVNRKENKLVKGNGYHLDMLVVAVCIAICSILGLPWYVAATVSAMTHITSLKKESETAAPGEKPVFLGCREQRVTSLMVGILSGTAVFLTGILKVIPMPVLYGVFLYMGVSALKGMQFVDRLALIFMPAKYQPDLTYLRHVKIKRVHLFTFIQILSLAVLWVIKMITVLSIAFPIMVVGTCFVRKAMDFLFTQQELSYLDDLMPEDDKHKKEREIQEKQALLGNQHVSVENGNQLTLDFKKKHSLRKEFNYQPVPTSEHINITEEINKTEIWMQLRETSPIYAPKPKFMLEEETILVERDHKDSESKR